MNAGGDKIKPKIIKLDMEYKYRRLFSIKNRNAVAVRSGHVVLRENENIGEHSTEDTEEVIIILGGRGELTIGRKEKLNFENNSALYIPPDTIHDVKNTGKEELKYVYVACPAYHGK
jgi:mannose-6-phosphate isomerase-like protein (cupin superfamily)